jgi:hypothetical protein
LIQKQKEKEKQKEIEEKQKQKLKDKDKDNKRIKRFKALDLNDVFEKQSIHRSLIELSSNCNLYSCQIQRYNF